MKNKLIRLSCSVAMLILIFAIWVLPLVYAEESSRVVRVIETEGVSRMDADELIDLICNCTGSELDIDKIRIGIRRAFKTGLFLDIKIITEPLSDGIKLKYVVSEVPVIYKVTIEGNEQFSKRQLNKVMTYRHGDNFRVEDMEKVRMSIINFYQRRGFPDISADITVEHVEQSKVNIRIAIKEGSPVIIKHVTSPVESRFLVSLSAGEIYDRDEMDIIIGKLKKYYKSKAHIKPSVGPYIFKEGELIIPVSAGPKLKVVFQGNSVISTRRLQKEVTYLENEDVSDELTAEITERLMNMYLKEGYYYAQVAAGTETREDTVVVTFIIYEGQRVTLRSVNIAGVSINEEALRKVISLPLNKPFDKNSLKSSREALIRFYQALGYLDVEVRDIKQQLNDEGTGVDLGITIVEGSQKKIAGIEVTGNKVIPEATILRALRIKKDLPYNRIDVGDARYKILSLYSQQGYIDTQVDVESIVENDAVFIKFKILENQPSVVGKIILRGNNITKANVIGRELTLQEGELYDSEEVTKIKQNLYKLGLFNEVSVELQDPHMTSGEKDVRDMLIKLKESNAGSVEFSFGYGDYEEFRGALEISYNNVGGRNRRVGFRTELSSVEKRFVLNFKEPWLFNEANLPLNLYLVKEETRSVDIDDRNVFYKIDKLSLIAGIEREIMRGFKIALNYEYSFTDTKDVQPGVILSKEDTGTLGIGSISTSLFYDTRDNPFDPTSGSIHGITLKFASVAFLSEIEFMKGSFQSSWFMQLHKRVVFAFSLRGGIAYSYEDTQEVPLIERFFLGGRSSARGYENDSLGPKGEKNTPTGGNVFALINNELRFTLGKGIGLVTFVDAGNVWRTLDSMGDELKYTVGSGLRYKTPVGPLRIDYGHKLEREPGESAGEVHFSFGHAF